MIRLRKFISILAVSAALPSVADVTFRQTACGEKTGETNMCLVLENDWLKVAVLPARSGRLVSFADKRTGREIFNCPGVNRRRATERPLDWRMTERDPSEPSDFVPAAGSKTIWFGETEPRRRLKWTVGLTLMPDRAAMMVEYIIMNRSPFIESIDSDLFWCAVPDHAKRTFGCCGDRLPVGSWIGPYETRKIRQFWFPEKGADVKALLSYTPVGPGAHDSPLPKSVESEGAAAPHANAELALGVRLARDGAYGEARPHLERAVQCATQGGAWALDAEPEYYLALCLAGLGEEKKAEGLLWRCTCRSTVKKEAFFELIRLFCRQQRYRAAHDILEFSLYPLAMNEAKLHTLHAFVHRKLRDCPDAMAMQREKWVTLAANNQKRAFSCDPLEYWGVIEETFREGGSAAAALAKAERNRGQKAGQLMEAVRDYAGLGAWDEVAALCEAVGKSDEGTVFARFRAMARAGKLGQKLAAAHAVTGQDTWHGFRRTKFDFDGHAAWIVEPSVPSAEGMPWTWTMQWAEAFVDRTGVLDLLKRGYHHVTIDLFETRMDEKGLATATAFQKFLVEELGFAPQANLVGMSWGGFFSTRYAATHPENVAKIYLDAPLLTFDGFGSPDPERIGVWAKRMPAKGVWADDPEMPVNLAGKIAAAKIPVLLVYGGADTLVPPKQNGETFAERFRAAGGSIVVNRRGLFGHHPHGLDPDKTGQIVDFFSCRPR